MFTDTHAHLDSFPGPAEADAALARAFAAGVTRILAVGGSAEGNAAALAAARQHPGRLRAAVGLDRSRAGGEADFGAAAALARDSLVAAVGETGLDYHYDRATSDAQKQLFRRHLRLACDQRLPIVVHSREADDDTLALLREHASAWTGDAGRIGVVHCFTGTRDFAERLLDIGLFISFSGILTFRNAASLREVARTIPGDRLLIETDTPYLAPVPHRGRGNEPAFLPLVAAELAKIRNDTLENIAHSTSRNADVLFGFNEETRR